MADNNFISIESVSKRFGAVRAVDDVSIGIAKGEFFGLLGPSGCGKTTLLRMLGGFETPTSGAIHIDGEPMAAVPPFRRPVNMVFQNYAIFPHLNVFQNIAFGLRKERLPRAELDGRVRQTLAMIRLEGYSDRAAHELSGGQRQRVALARALIKQPKVLLLDEPLGALDKKLREQMQLELRELQRSLGITFVFVTHDQEEALTMSDRIAVMAEGRILEHGAPSELYSHPRSRFVAEFLGAMNFFEGTVREARDQAFMVETDRLGSVRAGRNGECLTVGDRVTVALRPESLQIATGDSAVRGNAVDARIRDTAYLGDRTHFYVTTDDDAEPILVGIQNLDGRRAAFEGTAVKLTWSDEAVLLIREGP